MKHFFIISILLFFLSSCGLSQDSKSKEGFNDLRETISVSSEELENGNKNKTQRILEEIEGGEATAESKRRKTAIYSVLAIERNMNDYLAEVVLRAEAVAESTNPGEVEGSEKLFLGNDPSANGGEGDGLAFKTKERFAGITQSLNSIREDWGGEPLLSPTLPDPEREGSWARQTFANTPIVASLAMLEKYKLDLGNMVDTTLELLD